MSDVPEINKAWVSVRKFVEAAKNACYWCGKGSEILNDGRHVHETVVTEACALGELGSLLALAKSLLKSRERKDAK